MFPQCSTWNIGEAVRRANLRPAMPSELVGAECSTLNTRVYKRIAPSSLVFRQLRGSNIPRGTSDGVMLRAHSPILIRANILLDDLSHLPLTAWPILQRP